MGQYRGHGIHTALVSDMRGEGEGTRARDGIQVLILDDLRTTKIIRLKTFETGFDVET